MHKYMVMFRPPNWLVTDIIVDDGFSIIYGDPGAGKSFVALDMALRVALGMDWHGIPAKQAGVLYIAGEGARGIGKRVTGWRMHRGLDRLDCPFVLLPVAVQLLDPGERTKLLRTIDEAVRKAGFPIGLIVVDTVSRAIAGQDENGQETMSAFVAACDAIKAHAGGALLGIHHSGKDKDKGMRGSTVLLGACDGVIKLTKSERLVTLAFEKQKDAEEARPFYMQLEKVAWNTGSPDAPGEDYSTLVPVRVARPQDESETFSRLQIGDAFALLVDGWINGKPLSCKPQTRRDGRFAPAVFARKIGGQEQAWEGFLTAWLETGNVSYEIFDRKAKIFGLRVIDAII